MSPMFHSTIDNPDGDIKASDNKSGDNKNSRLDLYNLVSHHPEATFFIKYQGRHFPFTANFSFAFSTFCLDKL